MNVTKRGKVIVTCALTGNQASKTDNKNVPITPEEIINSAIEAYKAGAVICHIHARDPDTHLPTTNWKIYEKIFNEIRNKTDLLINFTTSTGARIYPQSDGSFNTSDTENIEKRLMHVVKLKPDICSLDIGSLNFGNYIFANPLDNVIQIAAQVQKVGVKPELEIFDVGHIEIAKYLIENNHVESPAMLQLCLGIRWGAPAMIKTALAMYEMLPNNTIPSLFGIGPSEFPMVALSGFLGGHVRVGMEDNLYLSKGNPAKSNAELVEKAIKILNNFQMEIATPKEAKEILGL